MNDAGIPLIAGTDAPAIPGLVPGFSLHDDLEALEGAGLTAYQALATATRVPGEFVHRALGDTGSFGTVTTGARADLILSESNPLDDLSTLRRPLGVMANGKWYTAAELKEFLEQVALEYNRALRLNRAGSALLAHR
jgi:imidazolonepropionase-like amidohydrolase